MASGLSKSLGVFRGAALLLNIVIGAGLLTLPGLAIKQLGNQAFSSWIVCALSALPLLAVFIVLGRRYPEAGGVTAYALRAFGEYGRNATTALFLGAVVLGLPAISLAGGHYIASSVGGNPHVYGFGLILLAAGLHFLPGEGAAKAMTLIASGIISAVIVFLIIGAIGLIGGPPLQPIEPPSLSQTMTRGGSFMMLFFAFTGWEVGAGIAEEFKEPKFQYPAAMLLSFALATALYLSSAFIAQNVDLGGNYEAPFVAMTRPIMGRWGASAVAIVAGTIILANLASAIWGVSRLIFSLARDKILPSILTTLSRGKPIAAVVAISTVLILVLGLDGGGLLGLEKMIAIAGQNFLLIYGVAAGALIVLSRTFLERFLGIGVLLLVILLMVQHGEATLYPMALLGLSAAFTYTRRWVASTGTGLTNRFRGKVAGGE